MSYESELGAHYAKIHRRLLGPEKKQTPLHLVKPEPPEPEKPHSVKLSPPSPPIKLGLKPLFIWLCEKEGFHPLEVKSDTRKLAIARVRLIFYHLANYYKTYPFTRIGRFMDRDHTTVMVGVRNLAKYRERDSLLNERVSRYEAAITAALNVNEEKLGLCSRCPFKG